MAVGSAEDGISLNGAYLQQQLGNYSNYCSPPGVSVNPTWIITMTADARTMLLLEVDGGLLGDLLAQSPESGEPCLQIRGHPDDDAAVCTASQTFILKSTMTSNCQLLYSPKGKSTSICNGGEEHPVLYFGQEIFELAPQARPDFGHLQSLLEERVYDGATTVATQKANALRLTLEWIQANVPASDTQIQDYLVVNAVLIDGEYRQLGLQYTLHLVKVLMLCLYERFGEFTKGLSERDFQDLWIAGDLCSVMEHRSIFEFLQRRFFIIVDGGGDGVFKLDLKAIARIHAEAILVSPPATVSFQLDRACRSGGGPTLWRGGGKSAETLWRGRRS